MSLIAPHTLPGGQRAWLDAEVQEFTQRLTELDERLALYQDPDGSWLIARIAEDGSIHYIMKSKPGARLGPHVLQKLVEGDTRRRGHQPVEAVIRANEATARRNQEEAEEKALEMLDNVLSKSWRGRIPTNVEDQVI